MGFVRDTLHQSKAAVKDTMSGSSSGSYSQQQGSTYNQGQAYNQPQAQAYNQGQAYTQPQAQSYANQPQAQAYNLGQGGPPAYGQGQSYSQQRSPNLPATASYSPTAASYSPGLPDDPFACALALVSSAVTDLEQVSALLATS